MKEGQAAFAAWHHRQWLAPGRQSMGEWAQLPRPRTPGPAVLERTAMEEGVQIPSLAGTDEARRNR